MFEMTKRYLDSMKDTPRYIEVKTQIVKENGERKLIIYKNNRADLVLYLTDTDARELINQLEYTL